MPPHTTPPDFNEQPNFGTHSTVDDARALPQAAVDFRWPFMRDSGAWGTQVIEPMLQLVVAPQAGTSQNDKYPNEDSLDLEFTDANLFGFNRFPGIDRLEGGVRLNAALHGTWYLGGTTFDGVHRPILPHHQGQRVSGIYRPARPGLRCRRACLLCRRPPGST